MPSIYTLRQRTRSKPRCRLDDWSLRVPPFVSDCGAIVLTGRVFGHCEFADGTKIVTGRLSLIVRTDTTDLAHTNSAVYELSAAHPDLIAAFLDAN